MTEHDLFHDAPFPPEVIHSMTVVFDEVIRERGLAARRDPICELVANAILDCAREGHRDPAMMQQCAHEALGIAQGSAPPGGAS